LLLLEAERVLGCLILKLGGTLGGICLRIRSIPCSIGRDRSPAERCCTSDDRGCGNRSTHLILL
jgi:hypothetical protein